MNSKLKSRREIMRLVPALKAQGKKIVTINGSFDLLHVGHIRLLQEAKKQGDVLIVGLNSDSSVRKWKKRMNYKDWAKRPLNPQAYRREMLSALECVDYVTIFNEPTCFKFIASVRPDVHVNGSDYGKNCIESATVKRIGARLHIVELHKGFSTSSLIKKILEVYNK
ncbi:MAG: adenylyltransferase/cytidyltransferase family protein [Candidatus Woesearchaeota archaeon]